MVLNMEPGFPKAVAHVGGLSRFPLENRMS